MKARALVVVDIYQRTLVKPTKLSKASLTGPWAELTDEDFMEIQQELELEMVRDFERIEGGYII